MTWGGSPPRPFFTRFTGLFYVCTGSRRHVNPSLGKIISTRGNFEQDWRGRFGNSRAEGNSVGMDESVYCLHLDAL